MFSVQKGTFFDKRSIFHENRQNLEKMQFNLKTRGGQKGGHRVGQRWTVHPWTPLIFTPAAIDDSVVT